MTALGRPELALDWAMTAVLVLVAIELIADDALAAFDVMATMASDVDRMTAPAVTRLVMFTKPPL
jgi:hypothetical protein